MTLVKTGGGEAFTPTDRITHELAVSVMNQKTVHGIQNNFDDDFLSQPSFSNDFTTKNYIIDNNNVLIDVYAPANEFFGECCDLAFENETENLLSENEVIDSQSTEKNQEIRKDVDWGKWNPATLKTPVNNKLKRKSNNNNEKSWSNRRRPSVQEDTRQQYLELGKAKFEFVLLQKSVFEKNEVIRREREKEEYELKKKNALQLDIEIKKAQLQKLTKNQI